MEGAGKEPEPAESSEESDESSVHSDPLSERLARALNLKDKEEKSITIGKFIEDTGDDSIHLLQALVCLPFCFPIAIPGWGVVAGSVVIYSAFFQLRDKPLSLPPKIRDGKISKRKFSKVLSMAQKLIGFLEKWITPRNVDYFKRGGIQKLHGWIMIIVGILLWIPWPIFFPLSNFFPAIAVLLLSLSLMEYDGRVVWISYILSIFSLIYTILLIYLGKELSELVMQLLNIK